MKSFRYTSLLLIFGVGLFLQPPAIFAQDAVEGQPATTETTIESAEKTLEKSDTKLFVYYFHGRKRCMSCRTIEAYTHDAILQFFPDQLESGRMEWQLINYANPKNKHFKDDFELYTQSVVLVEMKGVERIGWKNLVDVWKLKYNKDAFYEYINEELSAFLVKDN